MEVRGQHIKEWADVLAKIEQMVRLYAAEEGKALGSFDGNSLERLAKDGVCPDTRITYLPSRQTSDDGHDGHIVRFRKNRPDLYKRLVSGEMTMIEARKSAGLAVATNLRRAKSAVRKMTKKERAAFIDWMKEEGYL